jgi:hypothetical protein
MKNLGNFEFDGYLSDQVDPIFFSDEDAKLIKAHQEMFSAFYFARPQHVPRNLYHGLDFFGYASPHLAQTLYYILKTSTLTLLDLFTGLKKWLADERGIDLSVSGSLNMAAFHQLYAEYVEHLIENRVLTFPYLKDVLRFNLA